MSLSYLKNNNKSNKNTFKSIVSKLNRRNTSQPFPVDFIKETKPIVVKSFDPLLNDEIYTESNNAKNSNIKVVVRFRPLNEVERELINNNIGYKCMNLINDQNVSIKGENLREDQKFCFDRIFTPNISQEDIFDKIGIETVKDVVNGYNGSIFTYGQSSSGKTHTMYGNNNFDEKDKGIIPRTM